MRLHYINEPVRYIADVPVDKQSGYTFDWYFDNKIIKHGYKVKHIWNDVGVHTVELRTTDNKTKLIGIKTVQVNIVLPTLKHDLPVNLYSFSDIGFSAYYLYRFMDLTYNYPGDSDVFKFHDTVQLILG